MTFNKTCLREGVLFMRRMLFVFAFMCLPSLAAADTIAITSGSLTAFSSCAAGTLTLAGTGFSASANPQCGVLSASGLWSGGAAVPLSATWSGGDLPGTVQYASTSYPVGGFLTSNLSVAFDGTAVLPAFSLTTMTITAPFSLTGTFGVPINLPNAGAHFLTGSGIATITAVGQQSG